MPDEAVSFVTHTEAFIFKVPRGCATKLVAQRDPRSIQSRCGSMQRGEHVAGSRLVWTGVQRRTELSTPRLAGQLQRGVSPQRRIMDAPRAPHDRALATPLSRLHDGMPTGRHRELRRQLGLYRRLAIAPVVRRVGHTLSSCASCCLPHLSQALR